MSKFRYGVACSLNDVSTTAPITLRGPIEQLCKEAKEIGYDGLEIQLANPRQYDWNHIKTVCNDSGLELITFATGRELGENGLCLLSDDASVRRASIDRLKEHIDCAQSVGCNVIVGSMRKKSTGTITGTPSWSCRTMPKAAACGSGWKTSSAISATSSTPCARCRISSLTWDGTMWASIWIHTA